MIELRWAVPEGTSTQAPRLQYRLLHQIGLGHWGEWEDVPTVVVAQEPPQPAPKALVALGVNGKSPEQLRQELLSGQWDLSKAAEKPVGVLVDARVLAENLYHIAMYGDRGNGEKLMDAIEDALATAGMEANRAND